MREDIVIEEEGEEGVVRYSPQDETGDGRDSAGRFAVGNKIQSKSLKEMEVAKKTTNGIRSAHIESFIRYWDDPVRAEKFLSGLEKAIDRREQWAFRLVAEYTMGKPLLMSMAAKDTQVNITIERKNGNQVIVAGASRDAEDS